MSGYDPNYKPLYPLWVQMSSTSIAEDVQQAGKDYKQHIHVFGEDHQACETRIELEGFKSVCCICHPHEGCDL